MKSIMLASVLATVLAAAPALSAEGEKFSPIAHSAAVVLSEGTTQAEVDAQVRANVAAGKASYDAIARAGGCNADFLPTAVAAYCWRSTDGATDANPTGGPVGASSGGSDGGDGAAE
jgi:hypothetical protein